MAQSCFLYKSSSGIFGDYKLVQTNEKTTTITTKQVEPRLNFVLRSVIHLSVDGTCFNYKYL